MKPMTSNHQSLNPSSSKRLSRRQAGKVLDLLQVPLLQESIDPREIQEILQGRSGELQRRFWSWLRGYLAYSFFHLPEDLPHDLSIGDILEQIEESRQPRRISFESEIDLADIPIYNEDEPAKWGQMLSPNKEMTAMETMVSFRQSKRWALASPLTVLYIDFAVKLKNDVLYDYNKKIQLMTVPYIQIKINS